MTIVSIKLGNSSYNKTKLKPLRYHNVIVGSFTILVKITAYNKYIPNNETEYIKVNFGISNRRRSSKNNATRKTLVVNATTSDGELLVFNLTGVKTNDT